MVMQGFNHQAIEKKWQEKWEKDGLYSTPDTKEGKENFYALVEFPYPSGNLHVGHWYAFSVPDIFVRLKRMQGYNVLYPIGFDAFGLPAENAAIKRGLNPRSWTESNIAHMKKQLRSMGASFDWSREVQTIDPNYYKWTQWQFLQFLKNGLVYQGEATVNWCASCKTVLANEQVVSGKCERCGTDVEQRTMKQWMMGITKYAERLLSDLETLDWSEGVKTAQKNWIGKSVGAEVVFRIKDMDVAVPVFTTRVDTIFGVTYLVLAPEHRLVSEMKDKIENWDAVSQYVKESSKKTEIERTALGREKTGVVLKGITAVNPVDGSEIPVWIADYAMANYGTGAVMAVPAHDERDNAFAKAFGLPSVVVIEGGTETDSVFTGEGILIHSGDFDGMDSKDVRSKIVAIDGIQEATNYKLRDWVVSRQRYWGVPIPIIHCEKCGTVPVPDSDLPVQLPEIDDYLPAGDGQSPLAKAEKWVHVLCPKCGGQSKRETDTLDTFVDSSWYFLRYIDPENNDVFASTEKQKQWVPVDLYSGGTEHTNMHLLYSRFWHKALYDLGLVGEKEPFIKRMNRGLIMGPDGNKMSKSKGNTIDPDDVVERLGADTVRMYLSFIGPYNEVGSYPWNSDGIIGIRKFLERVWKLKERIDNNADSTDEVILNQSIKKVGDDIASLKMNTAVSQLMIFSNALNERPSIALNEYKILLQLLAPFAPHITEELWHILGYNTSIHLEHWPQFDASKIKEDAVSIAVQINGKFRTSISVPIGASEEAVVARVKNSKIASKWLQENPAEKIIFVPDRLINFVYS
jgi:leucyl-tRNA synthetase